MPRTKRSRDHNARQIVAPDANELLSAVLDARDKVQVQRGETYDRHLDRMMLVALFGLRRTELRAGLTLSLDGKTLVLAIAEHEPSNGYIGEARELLLPIKGEACAYLAGRVLDTPSRRMEIETSEADYRSLCRTLFFFDKLSCQDFEEMMIRRLRAAVAVKAITPEEGLVIAGREKSESFETNLCKTPRFHFQAYRKQPLPRVRRPR